LNMIPWRKTRKWRNKTIPVAVVASGGAAIAMLPDHAPALL
jgi:hypothetical protein